MTLGVILLFFVVYTLWGTRLQTAQAQAELETQFSAQVEPEVLTPDPDPAQLYAQLQAEWDSVSASDGPIARIQIPKIGVDSIVVAGTSREALKKGPGAFETTSLPGAPGNSAISAHRTTYGAEFNRLNELVPGDDIIVSTVAGETVYKVGGTETVLPKDIEVTYQRGANELTLTTCDPKFSAAKRLILYASMASGPFLDTAAPPAQPGARGGTSTGGGT